MRLADLRSRLMQLWPAADQDTPPPLPGLPELASAGDDGTATGTLAAPATRWTAERIAVADQLWGDGHVLPGGEEEVLRLAVPLGLSEASSLLMLGAAAGGPARSVVTGLGPWISGHEADPSLAALAAWRLPRAGKLVAKRATVAAWNPQAPVFRRHGFNHALALEALRGAPGQPVSMAELLVALAGALRPGGPLVLVDLVATGRLDPTDPVVRAWAEVEGRTPSCRPKPACPALLPAWASMCG